MVAKASARNSQEDTREEIVVAVAALVAVEDTARLTKIDKTILLAVENLVAAAIEAAPGNRNKNYKILETLTGLLLKLNPHQLPRQHRAKIFYLMLLQLRRNLSRMTGQFASLVASRFDGFALAPATTQRSAQCVALE